MDRTIGRRPLFFGAIALVCVALVPAAPPDFRWVAWLTTILAGFWAVLLAVEELTTPKGPREPSPTASENPFAPPPPPRIRR